MNPFGECVWQLRLTPSGKGQARVPNDRARPRSPLWHPEKVNQYCRLIGRQSGNQHPELTSKPQIMCVLFYCLLYDCCMWLYQFFSKFRWLFIPTQSFAQYFIRSSAIAESTFGQLVMSTKEEADKKMALSQINDTHIGIKSTKLAGHHCASQTFLNHRLPLLHFILQSLPTKQSSVRYGK